MEARTVQTQQSSGNSEQKTELKRDLGHNMLLMLIVGDIIGSGIYVLVGKVAGHVGGAIWASFALALILAMFTAGSYAELVTKYPRAAGAALYTNKAFKKPFITFMVAFAVMISGVTSASTAARAFGGKYIHEFISLPVIVVALAFIVVLAVINFRGIAESAQVNLAITIISGIGLLLIVLVGVVTLFQGGGDPSRLLQFKENSNVPLAIVGGAALSFYAFIGFEDSVNMAEEAKDPSRSFPRALIGGLMIAGVLYLLVAVTASMIVDTKTLQASSGPLLEVIKRGPIPIPLKLFALMALLAVTNSALINMLMASRLTYGMATQGIVPRFFGFVHKGRRTPVVAIIFTTAIAVVLIVTGDVSSLADTTVMLLLVAFMIVNISVLVLRKDHVQHDHFRIPTVVPILGFVACSGLLLQNDLAVFLRAAVLLAIGVVLWFINRWYTGRTQRLDTEALERISG